MGDLFESVFFVCLLISLLKRLHIVLIKTFTMHVEDVSMEIACKSAIYDLCLSDIASLLNKRSSAGIMKRCANKC